jgi:hypothetical protein
MISKEEIENLYKSITGNDVVLEDGQTIKLEFTYELLKHYTDAVYQAGRMDQWMLGGGLTAHTKSNSPDLRQMFTIKQKGMAR